MFKCIHCKKEIEGLSTSNKANHSRWCLENPKRHTYGKNGCKQMNTEEAISKRITGIKKAWADGKYNEVNHSHPGWKHSEETKQHLREKALASTHRRLVRSIREYVRKDGTVVMLDSSWEEALAKRLDETGVEWVRPKEPIPYISSDGKTHNYFPDFYLCEYDVFLDPKNPYSVTAQKEKLDIIQKQMPNLKIIKTLEECMKFNI